MSSIPSTFTHLQVRLFGRDERSASGDDVLMRFNGDTGSNYSRHYLFGDGTALGAGGGGSVSSMYFGTVSAASATSGMFGSVIGDILDYTNTNKNKVIRSIGGSDRSGSGEITVNSGAWYNTAAITSITILSNSSTNFVAGTRVDLYGITTSEVTGA
jgi:hypothetical protein